MRNRSAHARRTRGVRPSIAGAFALLLLAWMPLPSSGAALVEIRDDAPETYVVEAGDTLWDISATFLEEPWRWPEIWRVNPAIEDPHLIYPGDRIRLRYVDGRPVLELARGSQRFRVSPTAGTARLSPRIRATPLRSAIPAIDLEAIAPFLDGNRVVTEGALEAAGYVLQGAAGSLLVGPRSDFFARAVAGAPGDTLTVVRRGERYVDPDTGEFLGLVAEDVGAARVVDSEPSTNVQTLTLLRSDKEVRPGDRLLPSLEGEVTATFFPSAPDGPMEGYMISVVDGVTQIGQFSVVALDLGARDGLRQGDVLTILERGELVRDRVANETLRMPDQRAGLLMAFRIFERMSYGIVLETDRPLAVLDRVVSP